MGIYKDMHIYQARCFFFYTKNGSIFLILHETYYCILPNYRTCSYKRTVKQFNKVVRLLLPVYFYVLFFIKKRMLWELF